MLQKKIEDSGARDKSAEPFIQAVEALQRGEVIVFPTETFYGLGADAFNAVAVERVVSLKGRDPENPIPIIVAHEEMLMCVVAETSPMARRLMDRFWPGPLTLVLPAKKALPAPLVNRRGGIGVRISSHPVATQLVRELGHPLTATSANPSGREPARTKAEALAYFAGKLKIFLDGGKPEGKRGSTVVEIIQDQLRIIREGAILSQEVEKALR